jgi:Helix-turn-helix
VRLQEVCSALAELGFAIIPVSDTTSTAPLWTTGVEDATPVTLTMLPDDALVPATAAVPDLLGPHRAGQTLAGARGKEGLSQRQLAALTGIPQRHISEMENGKRPIGKANAGHRSEPGHPAPSMTCREGLTTLPGHRQLVDL